MRTEFCEAMVALSRRETYTFLTGDLGFMALEPLERALGPRFINAGVSEQNMVSVAAGMAREGDNAWVYSIAPFCYARPFEQIRNDVCINRLPVRLVGNGGGYAYGPMGATHHAIEDYGVLLTLPGLKVYVPAFSRDIAPMVERLSQRPEPAYLRLGRSESSHEAGLPPYAPWRSLLRGDAGLLIVVGPLAGALWEATIGLPEAERPALWVVSEIGADTPAPPSALLDAISDAAVLGIVEEHVVAGGFGQHFLHALALRGVRLPPVHHAHARGYPSGRYGSQQWHREECGLDVPAVLNNLRKAARMNGA